VTEPIDPSKASTERRELVELFNAMLEKAQGTIAGYNAVRRNLARALGEHSCIDELQQRLASLSDHCLTGLSEGLATAANGDRSVDARPVTAPLAAAAGEHVGQLGEMFNTMLGQAQGRIERYNAMRSRLQDRVGGMVGEIGALAGRVAASSQQMTASSQQVGVAVAGRSRGR